jgi:acyl-CoA synthetase (NDP forming)
VLTVSGGGGIWGADTVSMQGLQVPELSAGVQDQIKQWMPSYGAAKNPVDVTAQGVTSGGLQKSIELFDKSDEVDATLVVMSFSSDVRMPFKEAELKPVISAQNKPVVFYSYTLPSDFARRELAKSGVVVLTGLTHVGVALRRLVEYARFKLAPEADVTALPARDLAAHLKAPALSEVDSKALLCAAGIALPDEVLVAERETLDAAVERVGFPLVMKIQSPDIAHKSEVGGVRVGINAKGEAFSAYRELLENAVKHRPNADIQGVLVSPMAKKGVEIIIGTLLDKTFGPMVMVGLGGITTELFRDVVYRPAPVGVGEAETMVGELKAAPLLRGFRGAPKADVAALAKLISQVSVLAARLKDQVSEIELNPVLVHPTGQGLTIVDALVVRRK